MLLLMEKWALLAHPRLRNLKLDPISQENPANLWTGAGHEIRVYRVP